ATSTASSSGPSRAPSSWARCWNSARDCSTAKSEAAWWSRSGVERSSPGLVVSAGIMSFLSLYRHGFARVAACNTPVSLADPHANAEAILVVARRCHERGAAVAVFPELALSGYAIDDLLLQDTVLDAAEAAIGRIVAQSAELLPVIV